MWHRWKRSLLVDATSAHMNKLEREIWQVQQVQTDEAENLKRQICYLQVMLKFSLLPRPDKSLVRLHFFVQSFFPFFLFSLVLDVNSPLHISN